MSIEPSSHNQISTSQTQSQIPSKQATSKSWLSGTVSIVSSTGSSALSIVKSIASTTLSTSKKIAQHPFTQSVAATAVSIGAQVLKTTVATSAHVLGKVIEKGTSVVEKIAELPSIQHTAKTTKEVISTTANVAYRVGIVAAYTAQEAVVFTAKKLFIDPDKIHQEKEKAKKVLDEKMNSTSLGQSAHFLSLYATEYLKSVFQKDSSFTESLAALGIEMSSSVLKEITDLNLILAFTRMITNLEKHQKSNPTAIGDMLSSLFKNSNLELTTPSTKNTPSKEISHDVTNLVLDWAFPGGAKDILIPSGYLLDSGTTLIQEKLFNQLNSTIFPEIFKSSIDSFLYKNQTRDKILNMLIELIHSSLDNFDVSDKSPAQKSTYPAAPEDFQKTTLTLSKTLLDPFLEGLPFKDTIRKKIEDGINAQLPQLWHQLTGASLPELFQTTMEQSISGLFWGRWETTTSSPNNQQTSPLISRSFKRDENKPIEFFTTQKQWNDYYKMIDEDQRTLNEKSLKTLQTVQEKIYKKANISKEIIISEFKKQVETNKIEANLKIFLHSLSAFFFDFFIAIAKKKYGEKLSIKKVYEGARKFESDRTLSIASTTIKQKKGK